MRKRLGFFSHSGRKRLRPAANGRGGTRRGAAMIISIWTIALLSLLVMSFALDAKLEGKINVYVRNRRHVDYLTQSGIAIAEMILLKYKDASDSASTEEQAEDIWLQPKLDLQRGSCTVANFPVEAGRPENGVVTVEISSAEANRWPINTLGASDVSDKIWENILNVIGLPMEYQEEVVDSWYDWRDEDDTVTGHSGAESEYYGDLEKPFKPRSGEVASVEELKRIRGIRDRPAIYDGGLLNPEERDKKKQVMIRYGLKEFFDIWGESAKINVNSATKEVLMTVPGIDGDEELAGAIVEERETGVNKLTRKEEDRVESNLFKDWNDLNTRIPGGLQSESEAYLSYSPEKYFTIKVTGNSAGVTHTIETVASVDSDSVRYLRWREDP